MEISIGFILSMIAFMPAGSYLTYVNYLARIKYKEHFRERTKLWLIFDKRGLTVLALILHFAIMTGILVVLASYSQLLFLAGLECGVVWFNTMIDDRTLKRKLSCVETKCANVEAQRKCLDCAIPDK